MKKLSFVLGVLVLAMVLGFFFMNLGQLIKGGITGNQVMGTRLVIIAEEAMVCNFTAQQGWNLVSFPCITTDTPLIMLLNSSSYESIRYYSTEDASDPWKTYNPGLPPWVIQDLSSLSRRGGYWLEAQNTSNIYINNTLATPTLISLRQGWNLIGYPSKSSRHITEIFNDTIPDFAYVYMYNASDAADPWKQYTWNATAYPSDQDLEYLNRYYGYWVLMVAPGEVGIDS